MYVCMYGSHYHTDNEETDQDEVMNQSEMTPSNVSLDESDDDFDDLSSNCYSQQ